MQLEALRDLAARQRLYPGVILHGGTAEARHGSAVDLARTLLCERATEARPCGECRHCRRIAWPGESDAFHPDFHVLERDLKTATSAAAAKAMLSAAYAAPFEARGQVFVVAEAESLSGEAADAFLKILEEPPLASPRHFLLLAASRQDLLPTLQSRSLAIYLGAAHHLDQDHVQEIARGFGTAVRSFFDTGAAVYLLSACGALEAAGGWDDPRDRQPWALAAAAVLVYVRQNELGPEQRRRLLAFAEAILDGPRWRIRGITHGRLLEGWISRYLAA